MQFRRKEPEVQEPMDLDSVMKKYDQESNTRIWEGKPKIAVTCILAVFSLFCLYVTLFASWLEEWRLTSFVAGIVLLGFLVYPARKGVQRVNHIPWYDIVMMVAGTGAFLYFTFNAMDIIQQGSRFAWYFHLALSALRAWLRYAGAALVCLFWWLPDAFSSMR